MFIDTDKGYPSDAAIYTIIISLAALVSLITVVTMCLCCYGQPNDDDKYESLDENSGGDIYSYEFFECETDASTSKSLLPATSSVRLSTQPVNKDAACRLSTDLLLVSTRVQPEISRPSTINRLLRLSSRGPPPLPAVISLQPPAARTLGHPPLARTPSVLYDYIPAETANSSDHPDCGSGVVPDCAVAAGTAITTSLGRIQFHLGYNFENMTLNLRLICAESLPAKDFSGTSDPYVKIVLLPNRKHRLVSNIKRKSLNPHWNELFTFEGYAFTKLSQMTLHMQVLDYDRFSRDDPIGEVSLPLKTVNLADGQTIWQHLQPCTGHAGKLGEVLLSLHYQPTPGLLTVGVIAARGLLAKDINGLSDPYVKMWLMYDGKRVEKQKTRTKQKTLDPTFNESFVFVIPAEQIRLTSLVVSVMDRDHIGQNELIGRVVFGPIGGRAAMDGGPSVAAATAMSPATYKHWTDVILAGRTAMAAIECWHVLTDSD